MIQSLLELIHNLTDPERLIHLLSTALYGWVGYLALFLIVFSESGLLVGFFLPGDSLLFTVGVVAGAGKLNVVLVMTLLMCASILGDGIGFLLGGKIGLPLFQRHPRVLRTEYLDRTRAFYGKHGGKTIIYAKFVPIIRTFAAFIAGVGQMPYRRFLSFNVIGAVGWVFSMITLGYMLGGVPVVRKYFQIVILLIILISVLPAFLQVTRPRRSPAS